MTAQSPSYTVPPIPENDRERLAELHELALLDATSETRFDAYTTLIADLFGFPIVLVSLVEQDRQWFQSARGLSLKETARDISFCAHAINYPDIFIVPDACKDPRFAKNPMVIGEPFIRFYAGAVVHGPKGSPLGTLCVIDKELRVFNDDDSRRLRRFADLVEREIRHRYDLKMLRASVEFTAYYDPLTKLPNRRLLLDRLQKLVEAYDQEPHRVAVLLFNVSSQRLFNQSFGSEAGDALLSQVAERLVNCNAPGGTVARLQADEFVIAFALPLSQEEYLDHKLEDIQQSLAAPFAIADREYFLNITCGVSLFPNDGLTPIGLIERASTAIRLPRQHGDSQVRFFNSLESINLSDRLEIESRLRGAVETGAFTLVYQPIVSIQDGSLARLEALIRWEDTVLGTIPPDSFIPIAEESDLIGSIGAWVLNRACDHLTEWIQNGDWSVPVAINISARELMQPDFGKRLVERLKQSQLPQGMLCLEITETSLATDSPGVSENIAVLQEASIPLSIDDFGTGYSSLTYLQRLPLSALKIDRSFICGLPEEENDIVLTRAVISIAQGLKLETVAEGVETEAQLAFLKQAACDYAQGFLISRPVSANQVYELHSKCFI